MQVKAIAKRWGSSIGVIIPKEVVEAKHIKENDELLIHVETGKPQAGVLFGKFPHWKSNKSTQELKDEMRAGWESDSDRKRWK